MSGSNRAHLEYMMNIYNTGNSFIREELDTSDEQLLQFEVFEDEDYQDMMDGEYHGRR